MAKRKSVAATATPPKAEKKSVVRKAVKPDVIAEAPPAPPPEIDAAASAPAVEKPKPAIATSTRSFQPVLCFAGESNLRIFGLTPAERLRRQFAREGLETEIAFADLKDHRGPVILVSANCVLDQPLIGALLKRPNLVLTTEKEHGGRVLAANIRAADAPDLQQAMQDGSTLKNRPTMLPRAPSELDTNFWKALRKRETPYALSVTPETMDSVSWRMFMGTYKGATDLVTKHVWPRPAYIATRWLAPRGITPNMVTTVGAIMTVAAFVLFLYGQYAWGLAAAWAMTFLDTVDGKLARTTLTSSKWGDVFDHGIDLVHPPFWYVAWGLGLAAWGITWNAPLFWWTIGIIMGGYVLQRLMEGIAIKWLGLEIHIWRPVDTFFRQITARRNPNLILLTLALLARKPDWGLLAVAAWTLICLALHGIQLVQALAAKPKDGPLVSWMTKP